MRQILTTIGMTVIVCTFLLAALIFLAWFDSWYPTQPIPFVPMERM
jgi:hypothetical protein